MKHQKYNIGIIGSGAIGSILGTYWAKVGHQIMFSSRHPEKLQSLVENVGENASKGSVEEAAAFGDILLFAVNYTSVDEAIEKIQPFVKDKIIIDATNPVSYTPKTGLTRLIPTGITAGEFMQKKLPNAILVKSYTTLWSKYLERESNREGDLLVMPVSSNNLEARTIVQQLVKDSGFLPYDLGSLSQSEPQDPGSSIWNQPLTYSEFVKTLEQD